MAFSVNPHSTAPIQTPGARPFAPAATTAPSPAPAPPPTSEDQVQISPPPAATPPEPQVLGNGLKVRHHLHNGALTGLHALLPGGPGHLLANPVILSLSLAPGEGALGGKFQQAAAFEAGPDGKALKDEQGNVKELPVTVMSDGRAYVQADKNNPSAPLVMLDNDGSFGLATPARTRVEGDAQGLQGYSREQAEFVRPDGTRAFRLNEQVGAFSQAPQGSSVGKFLGQVGLGTPQGREVSYTELEQTPQNALESRDLRFHQSPGERWPQYSLMGQWKSSMSLNGSIDMRPRSVQDEGHAVRLEGGWSGKRMLSLLTGGSGKGMSGWTYASQETVRFVPLSRQGAAPPPPTQAAPPPVQASAPPPLPADF